MDSLGVEDSTSKSAVDLEVESFLDSVGMDLESLSPFDVQLGQQAFRKQSPGDEGKHSTPHITESDYTEDEAFLLRVLKGEVRNACNAKTTTKRRRKALEWCFVRGVTNKQNVTFHSLCTALGARRDVIQARIHRQLYLSGIILEEPLPLMMDSLPWQYESEALMTAWESGVLLVQNVWRHPGIRVADLAEKMSDLNLAEVLEKMEPAGLVSCRFGHVFLAGRSDEVMKRRTFSWSRSFL